jgi:hypothetical protein
MHPHPHPTSMNIFSNIFLYVCLFNGVSLFLKAKERLSRAVREAELKRSRQNTQGVIRTAIVASSSK